MLFSLHRCWLCCKLLQKSASLWSVGRDNFERPTNRWPLCCSVAASYLSANKSPQPPISSMHTGASPQADTTLNSCVVARNFATQAARSHCPFLPLAAAACSLSPAAVHWTPRRRLLALLLCMTVACLASAASLLAAAAPSPADPASASPLPSPAHAPAAALPATLALTPAAPVTDAPAPSSGVVPHRRPSRFAYVMMHYEGTPKDDEYLLGLRVLIRSIRSDTNTLRDKCSVRRGAIECMQYRCAFCVLTRVDSCAHCLRLSASASAATPIRRMISSSFCRRMCER